MHTSPTLHRDVGKNLLPVKPTLIPEEAVPEMELNRSKIENYVFIKFSMKKSNSKTI